MRGRHSTVQLSACLPACMHSLFPFSSHPFSTAFFCPPYFMCYNRWFHLFFSASFRLFQCRVIFSLLFRSFRTFSHGSVWVRARFSFFAPLNSSSLSLLSRFYPFSAFHEQRSHSFFFSSPRSLPSTLFPLWGSLYWSSPFGPLLCLAFHRMSPQHFLRDSSFSHPSTFSPPLPLAISHSICP